MDPAAVADGLDAIQTHGLRLVKAVS